jgi:hypothetical protein
MLDALRKSTPQNRGTQPAVSACAFVVMVILGFDLSNRRLPEERGRVPMQISKAWSRALSTAVNHACYLWLGEIDSCGALQRSWLWLLLQPLTIATSSMGPASNLVDKGDFQLKWRRASQPSRWKDAREPARSLSVKQTHQELSDGRKMVLSLRHRVSVMVKRSFVLSPSATPGAPFKAALTASATSSGQCLAHGSYEWLAQRTWLDDEPSLDFA